MASTPQKQAYSTEKVRWVHDSGGVFVFLPGAAAPYYLLTGWEACCWEWALAGMSPEEMAALSADFLDIEPSEAAASVDVLLGSWLQNGLLTRKAGSA